MKEEKYIFENGCTFDWRVTMCVLFCLLWIMLKPLDLLSKKPPRSQWKYYEQFFQVNFEESQISEDPLTMPVQDLRIYSAFYCVC